MKKPIDITKSFRREFCTLCEMLEKTRKAHSFFPHVSTVQAADIRALEEHERLVHPRPRNHRIPSLLGKVKRVAAKTAFGRNSYN